MRISDWSSDVCSSDLYTREESVRFAHALPRGRLHIVAGAHHALPSEMPGIFNRLALRFLLARNPAGGMSGAAMRTRVPDEVTRDDSEPTPMPDEVAKIGRAHV